MKATLTKIDNDIVCRAENQTRNTSSFYSGGMCSWNRACSEAIFTDPIYGRVKMVDGKLVEMTPEEMQSGTQGIFRRRNEDEFQAWWKNRQREINEKYNESES